MNTFSFLLKKKTNNISYYVSPQGDDNADGSYNTPFRSIDKVNSVIQGGDTIAFKKGGTYYGKLALSNKDNITLISYGSGSLPILKSTKIVNSSITVNGNVYSYQDNTLPAEINNLYANTIKQTVGIYPKSSYYHPTGGWVNYLDDTNNPAVDNYWDGCQVVHSAYFWYILKQRVSTYTSKRFNYVGESQYKPRNAGGYFIQNHINCLQSDGEYAYNSSSKTVHVYSTSAITTLEIPIGDHLFYFNNCDNITIKDLNFDLTPIDQVRAFYCNNVLISNCKFSNSGVNGINFYSNSNCTVKNNAFEDIGNSAIVGTLVAGFQVTDNTLDRVAYIIGQELDTATQGTGIFMSASHTGLIKNNDIKNISGNGVFIQASGDVNVYQNWVHKICLNKHDLGGIYYNYCNSTSQTNYNLPSHQITIDSNIIEDVFLGDKVVDFGGGVSGKEIYGIYCDDYNEGSIVTNNYIYGGLTVLYLKEQGHTVTNNYFIGCTDTTYPTRKTVYTLAFLNTDTNWDYNTISNNIIIHLHVGGISAINTNSREIHNTISANKYYYPFNDPNEYTYNQLYKIVTTYMNITNWKADDSNVNWHRSTESVITPSLWINSNKSQTNYVKTISNPSKVNLTISQSDLPYTDYINLDGTIPSYPITVLPYGALVLVRKEN